MICSGTTFFELRRKIFGGFLFLGKDVHFQNFFGKHLWNVFLGRY